MANEKKYFEFLDIPGDNGNTERWYIKDEEARALVETTASIATCESIVDELT